MKVPLEDDELLICDARVRSGQSQIVNADIDTSRRQAFLFTHADAVGVLSGLWKTLNPGKPTVQAALDEADKALSNICREAHVVIARKMWSTSRGASSRRGM